MWLGCKYRKPKKSCVERMMAMSLICRYKRMAGAWKRAQFLEKF